MTDDYPADYIARLTAELRDNIDAQISRYIVGPGIDQREGEAVLQYVRDHYALEYGQVEFTPLEPDGDPNIIRFTVTQDVRLVPRDAVVPPALETPGE